MITFYDTSALLHLEKPFPGEAYVSPIVFQELEHIKTDSRDEHKKYIARQLVNSLIDSHDYIMKLYPRATIDEVLHQFPFLSDIPDHRLIAEAYLVANENPDELFKFVTCDGAQFLFANTFENLHAEFIDVNEVDEEQEVYVGWNKYLPTDEQMASLYSNPNHNIFNAKINEYLCICDKDDKVKDILRWDGTTHQRLCYKDINIKNIGLKVRPRNNQQKMAMDLLQNPDIPIKLVTGVYGSGKQNLASA